ncbi:MAG: phenylalanine--tRNA ligase subunit beta [Desulfomonile sp.]|nr:phenylalanine--tRNA ligase subunit beta [Desulfomonile sp.]
MLVSFNWLKEFVEIDQSPAQIADVLTMGGIEVEAVTRVGDSLDRVYTARIEEISAHPSAETLSLARISLGDRMETVVCGAPNIRIGQIVPYAAPGAVLPSGLEISERSIKGVRSPGMICSAKELDLGDDASGVLVFEPGTKPGLLLTEALPIIDDWVLDVGITPNRGDCLSIIGIAREVAALTNRPWRRPHVRIAESSQHIGDKMSIEVPDVDLCPRYVARLVEGVKIGPSPFTVCLRLYRSGMRPISNVVDVTNLVLMECGQPLHAFDYEFLQDRKIVVRRADPDEDFVTLDGQERKLPPNALTIRDGKRAVALAGIMGGLNSEIHDGTEAVLIESACFERFGIRRTAKALGMSTEASYRFERGVDPEGTFWAADRAADLISELAGGTVLAGSLDVYPNPIVRSPVTVRTSRVNHVLGTSLTKDEVVSYLRRLSIHVDGSDSDMVTATPPSWRWDLEREVDMIEEVARIYGFQNIPITTPRYRSAPDHTRVNHNRISKVADLMNAGGYVEAVTMSFVSREAAREFCYLAETAEELELLNPLSEDLAVMRTSLIPGLLQVMKRNVSFRSTNLRLYEVGKVFTPVPDEELPREDLILAGLATGRRYPELWHFNRGEINTRGAVDLTRDVDFYDIKGAVETLLDGLGVKDAVYVPSKAPFLHPGKSADLVVEGRTVGYLGELLPAKTREHGLEATVQIFEIFVEPLFVAGCKESVFKPIPRYPYVERDLSIIVEEKVSGDTIKQLISRLGHDIIDSVILFDLYRGESIPEGFRSLAFRIRYQSEDRTLTDAEVQEVHSQIAELLTREVGAAMRE